MDGTAFGDLADEGLWEDLYSAEAETFAGSIIIELVPEMLVELGRWLIRIN